MNPTYTIFNVAYVISATINSLKFLDIRRIFEDLLRVIKLSQKDKPNAKIFSTLLEIVKYRKNMIILLAL